MKEKVQTSIFDFLSTEVEGTREKFTEEKPMRVFEAFSGVGSQRMALRNLGIPHKVVAIAEIDKFALQSYEAIHGDCPNLGDISKIDTNDIPDHDLFTYSFPCQDLSIAGTQKGLTSETRSGLLYECEKVIEVKRPKYLLLENVKNLVGKKFKNEFDSWLTYLESLGYTNYWQVLNAKDYGTPQNRERVFVVSILNGGEYKFPKTIKLEKRVKDLLEFEVDEKYYLSGKMLNYILDMNNVQQGTKWEGRADNDKLNLEVAHTISVRGAGGGQRAGVSNFIVDGISGEIKVKEFKELLSTDTTMCLNSKVRGKQPSLQDRIYDSEGVATAITTSYHPNYTHHCRVRKLTPLECWRLMGFTDEDFFKAKQSGVSDSQLYKQAGNSIVVQVLENIFKELFC